MRKLLLTAMVIGIGALGFAVASKAGISMPGARLETIAVNQDNLSNKFIVPGCRIEKTWKYDFHGNPYLKKVRICA